LIGGFLIVAFAFGFYLANLYSNISLLIEQRRAALTSAVYSAPMVINVGDEVGALHLIDRLQALSYSRVETPSHPGEYSIVPRVMTIYVREFSLGTRGYPSTESRPITRCWNLRLSDAFSPTPRRIGSKFRWAN
jgi:hypothetical protein